jgi:hypothetical protein
MPKLKKPRFSPSILTDKEKRGTRNKPLMKAAGCDVRRLSGGGTALSYLLHPFCQHRR